MDDTHETATVSSERAHASRPDDHLVDRELLDDELLVEEISIDGMCGVY